MARLAITCEFLSVEYSVLDVLFSTGNMSYTISGLNPSCIVAILFDRKSENKTCLGMWDQ